MYGDTCSIYVAQYFGKEIICYSSRLWKTIILLSDLIIDISVLLNCSEVVLCNDLVWCNVYGEVNIFTYFYEYYEVKFVMSQNMKHAPGVEMVIFMNSFAVFRSAIHVLTSPGNFMRFPSTLMWVQ